MPVVQIPIDYREEIQNRFRSFKEQIDLNALNFKILLNKEFLHLHAAAGDYRDKGPLFRGVVGVVKGNRIGQLEALGTVAEICAAFNAEYPRPSTPKVPEIKVIKSKKFENPKGKHQRLYRTRGRRRGALLIFSYYKFGNEKDRFRSGVQADALMLERVFSAIGFDVKNYPNLTYQQTTDCLNRIELEGYECVFVVVSSHGHGLSASGGASSFRTADGDYMLARELVDCFTSDSFPELSGVPKVFIFQACRGKKLFPKRMMNALDDAADSGGDDAADSGGDGGEGGGARLYSDMLIAYSTVPGYTSPRIGEQEQGCTWYMRALCEVFAAHAHRCHVVELFALVDETLSGRVHGQTYPYENWGFNRLLYLHPGFFEDMTRSPSALLVAAVLIPVVLITCAENRLISRLGIAQRCFRYVISFLPSLWRSYTSHIVSL